LDIDDWIFDLIDLVHPVILSDLIGI